MKWTDTQEIAMQLADEYPDVDPRNINFMDLHQWVMNLPEFDDDPERSGERILEAIQLAWMDEADVDD
ncbi:Fe-S cluster assembly protein IscX [Thioalkalivibrio sp.]|uniref:Fe-S cluster assembly protein IscX n=1 Tax=Thioalkalivibrio sp. TaxID=2093813 RepID=UPI0035628104